MIKKIIIVVSLLIFCYLAILFIAVFNVSTGDYLLTQFTYRILDNRVTHNIDDDWDKVKALNSWLYVEEDQSVSWLDVKVDAIDFNMFLNLVRGIGWCDQKAGGLITLLNLEGIKGRIVFFPSHTISEVIIGKETRYFDPTFNTELLVKDGKFARVDGRLYEGDAINSEKPRYSDYNDASLVRNLSSWVIGKYPKFYVNVWLEWYFRIRGNDLIKLDGVQIDPIYTEQYNSQEYVPLYKGRVYQLFGQYDKAQSYYESMLGSNQFHDEPVFYLVTLGLETNKQELVDKYTKIAESEIIGIPDNERSYLFLVPNYIERYNEVYRRYN